MKKYDKQKAHEYYMKHRKLKGRKRKAKAKVTGGKLSQRTSKRSIKPTTPKNIALQLTSSGGKGVKIKDISELTQIKAKLAEINARAEKLPPSKKKALKTALTSMRGKIKKG